MEIGFERTHAPGPVFTQNKLEVVVSGSKQEPGIVLNVLATNFARALHCELDGIAQVANREFPAFQRLTYDVDAGIVLVLFRDERNLRTGDNQRDREMVNQLSPG